jgi:Tol biopolymer transport system component
MNPNGTDIQQATFNTADDREPTWSPNGKKIAFDRFRGSDYDIVVMNPDGSRQKNRTSNSTAHQVESDWQPIVD